jgi:hypothetical protein
MSVHVVHVHTLPGGGIAVSPSVYEVPKSHTDFRFVGDNHFEIDFPDGSPFPPGPALTAKQEEPGTYSTIPLTVAPTAKTNRPYKFTVTAGNITVDPIIIIRTIQFYREIAHTKTIEELDKEEPRDC